MKRAALMMVLLATATSGEVVPKPGPLDGRVQSIEYNPGEVVALRVPLGYQVTLELAPDERIENVAVGDSGAWQVTPNRRGDHLFVKPIQPGVRTNLVVVTDARTYPLLLEPADGPGADIPFTVRYSFPVEGTATAGSTVPATIGRYRLKGARSVRPDSIADDGRRTTISWPAEAAQPAVFTVDPSGQEALVNGHDEAGSLVIEGVATRYLFRLGKEVAQADRIMDAKAR